MSDESHESGAEASEPSDALARDRALEAPSKPRVGARVALDEEPLVSYLAQLFAIELGYALGLPPQARALEGSADVVMTLQQGPTFALLAIVDATDDDDRRFEKTQKELVEIGHACSMFAGKVGLTKMPTMIHVVELRRTVDETDKERLGALARIPGLQKVGVTAAILGVKDRQAWTSSRLAFSTRDLLLRSLGPRKSLETLRAEHAPPVRHKPVVTLTTLGVMALFFALELAFNVGKMGGPATPSFDTLVAMGGVSPALVGEGEWWRLMTATLLHADPIHLLLNGVALAMGGFALESIVGRAWMAAIFVLGALGGSLASIVINDPMLVSVGASGAIMGVLAAAMIATQRMEPAERQQVMMNLARILIPSLLPIAVHRSEEGKIDFAAHFGGAITGALVGWAVLKTWKRGTPAPPARKLAKWIGAAGVAAYVLGFLGVSSHFEAHAEVGKIELVPNDKLEEIKPANIDALMAKYPRDWRVLWVSAEKAHNAGDLQNAERLYREALKQRDYVKRMFPKSELEGQLRAELAMLLESEGRHADAVEAAKPACGSGVKELDAYCH